MRTIALVLLGATTLYPVRTDAQAPDLNKLTGRWTGRGAFFTAELKKSTGPLPITIEFKEDRTGEGRIGKARLIDAKAATVRDHIEVKAKVLGTIAADPALAKDYVVFVVTAVTDSTMQAEFHLKSNLTYDARMREGSVTLRRSP